jgi:tetratricopeptide (TPR) repeat protein
MASTGSVRVGALSWAAFFLIALLSAAWTFLLYDARRFFPRTPADFRPLARLEKDLEAAKAVLKEDPENIAAQTDIALVRFQQGPDHYLAGLEALERARDLGALDDRLFYLAGVMYEAKGLLEFARPEYERFVRNHPDDAEARTRLGNLYYRLEDLEKAARQYEILMEKHPDDPLAAFNLAVVRRDQERWADGLALLEPLLLRKDWPLPEGGYKVLGDLYRGQGNPAQAIEFYRRELGRRQNDPGLWEDLARAHEQAGDLEQARAHWEQLLALDPKNRTALGALRQLKRQMGKKR